MSDKFVRSFDPLRAGLSRQPRRLRLPFPILRWFILCSAIIFVFFGMLMGEIAFSFALILGIYVFLVLATWEEDRGINYHLDNFIRKTTNDFSTFKGLSYEPTPYSAKKINGNLNFGMKQKAVREKMEANRLPYFRHYSPNIIINRNGDLMTIIKVGGIPFAMKEYAELEALKSFRADLWKTLGARFVISNYYVHKKMKDTDTPNANNWFANDFLSEYYKQFNNDSYVTDIYIAVIIRAENPFASPIARLKEIFKPKEGLQDELADKLNTAAVTILKRLASLKARRLSIQKDEKGVLYCESCSFIGYLLNLTEDGKDKIPFYKGKNVDTYIDFTRKVFKSTGEILFFRNDGNNKAGAVLGLPTGRLPEGTDHQMIDNLLSLQHEFVIAHTFIPADTEKSRKMTSSKEYDLNESGDRSASQIAALSDAMDDIDSGRIINGVYAMNILAVGKTKEELAGCVNDLVSACSVNRLHLRREDLIAEASYFSILPGNYAMLQRPAVVDTTNFAGLSSLHNNPLGKKEGNHWGSHILQIPTLQQSPYFFNWHVGQVGHTRFIAPTGGGKTTLLNALLTASMKADPYLFHFDSGYSASVFINAIGGRHIIVSPSVKTGWNPLHLPDTESNRQFLANWFAMMGAKWNEQGNRVPLSAKEENLIKSVIDKVYELPKEYRQLSYIMDYFPIEEEGNLTERLSKWVGNGSLANLFDNPEDTFSFEGATRFGFEMKYVMSTPQIMAAATMYIFHRINEFMVHCKPAILVFEEGQLFIQDENNERFLNEALTTFRRRNGMCIFVTPSPSIINQYSALREQFKTTILMPNKQANIDDYCGKNETEGGLFCTKHEFDWIKKTTEVGHFIVKQENDTVAGILNLATPRLEKFIEIFSGNEERYLYMKDMQKQYGMDVSDWLPPYLEYWMAVTAEKRKQERKLI